MSLFGFRLSPNRAREEDPVSLLFIGNAPARRIANLLIDDAPRAWKSTDGISGAMFGYVDDRSVGGSAGWRQPAADLELIYPPRSGPTWLVAMTSMRLHLRLYDATVVHPTWGRWCFGGVHAEHYGPPASHLVHHWNDPVEFVTERVSSITGARVVMLPGADGGPYQGVSFDGQIRVVEVA